MLKVCDMIYVIIMYVLSFLNISFLLKCKRSVLFFFIGLFIILFYNYFGLSSYLIMQFLIYTLLFVFLDKDLKKVVSAVLLNFMIIMIMDVFCVLLMTVNDFNILFCTVFIFVLSFIFIRSKMIINLWKMISSKKEYNFVMLFLLGINIYIYI